METVISQKAYLYLCLIFAGLLQTAAFAQDKEKKPKEEEEGTVRILIEKYENGKKKVIEKTYKSGELPGLLWGESFTDADSSFKALDKNLKFYTDSSFAHWPSTFYFRTPHLTDHHLFFFKQADSLQNRTFHNGFDANSLDSLLKKQPGNHIILQDMNNHLKSINIDSFIKEFNFKWT